MIEEYRKYHIELMADYLKDRYVYIGKLDAMLELKSIWLKKATIADMIIAYNKAFPE